MAKHTSLKDAPPKEGEYPKAMNVVHILVDNREEEEAFLEGRAIFKLTKSATGDQLEVVGIRDKD